MHMQALQQQMGQAGALGPGAGAANPLGQAPGQGMGQGLGMGGQGMPASPWGPGSGAGMGNQALPGGLDFSRLFATGKPPLSFHLLFLPSCTPSSSLHLLPPTTPSRT